MNIKEAIKIALDGDAILFAGAGFSTGVKNQYGKDVKRSTELCHLLCDKINMEHDDDLGYVSEKFIDLRSKSELIDILQSEYVISKVDSAHEQLAEVNWKRIYTTNYDDAIEKASDIVGNYKVPITLNSRPYNYINKDNLVIHLNGYIKTLTIEKLNTEFKLSRESYLTEDFINNDWRALFIQDIINSRAVFFVGYSLNYDIDIQRILVGNKELYDKCFFITHTKVSNKSRDIISKFGQIETFGVENFAKQINEIKRTYIPIEKSEEVLYCFRQFEKEDFKKLAPIKDKEIFDLFIKGEVNLSHVRNYENQKKYFVTRNEIERIMNSIENERFKFIIIHSDLGNGKTCIAYNLISKLVDYGKVFKLNKLKSSFSKEMEIISKISGKKFILIENYNLYINELKCLNLYKSQEIYFILTARSLINDIFYPQLIKEIEIDEDIIGLVEINELHNNEINDLAVIFDEYKLWGKSAASSNKFKVIKKYRRFQDLLIGLLESEYLVKEIEKIIDVISSNKIAESIILTSLINELLSLNLGLDDIIYLLNNVQISAKISKNTLLGELISVEQNKISVKSSIIASFILQRHNYTHEIIDILIKIMHNSDKLKLNSFYYQLMKMLVSFPNIKLILNSNKRRFADNVIRYYENIKNLEFSKGNPHFWLQYAIARLDLKQFQYAKIYFDNAYAFARSKKRNYDTYQIDTHYSRYLLERQIYEGNDDEAFKIFKEAHHLITGSRNKLENLHYPIRQTVRYYDFFEKFYKFFGENEKAIFMLSCYQIIEKINAYMNAIGRLNRRPHQEVLEAQRKLKIIIEKISEDMPDGKKSQTHFIS